MKYAPIALFVYNRTKHLKKTLNSLKKNLECKQTSIYIFSDGNIRNNGDEKKVIEVRKIIKKINYFKKIYIFENKKNIGLKKNIINGINYVLKKNKKIIVMEDDLIVSKYFLKFMNESLIKYNQNKKVWHISGWNYSFKKNFFDKNHAFFIKNMNCWGWATWKDRWSKLNLNSNFYIKKFNKNDKYLFNLNNSFENFSQITRNSEKKISTWAIFWSATIYYNNGLCLNPFVSLTKNIGQDKTGTNTVNTQLTNTELSKINKFKYPDEIIENLNARIEIIKSLKNKKQNLLTKFLRYF